MSLQIHKLLARFAFIASMLLVPNQALPQSADMTDDGLFEGVLEPFRDVDVATSEFGILRELLVKPGSTVKANEPLARLESRELQGQLAIAEAEYASRGKLKQVLSDVELQTQKVKLLRELKQHNNSNQHEIIRAEADLESAQARLQSEQESIEVLRLQVARLHKVLDLYEIRAPFDGVVVEVQRNIGEFVSASSPSVVKLHDISKLKATFPLSEVEIAGMTTTSTMSIRLSDGRIVQGTVDFIPPVAEPESGLFMVTVVIDNPDGSIRCSRCARAQ
jgi:RND family efflux transporter MFP subunit